MSKGKNTRLKPVLMSRLKSQVKTCLMFLLFFPASSLRNLPVQLGGLYGKKNIVILCLCFCAIVGKTLLYHFFSKNISLRQEQPNLLSFS
jgi:hypothetical protein